MQKLAIDPHKLRGSDAETQRTKPTPSSPRTWTPPSERRLAAAEATKMIYRFCSVPDTHDAKDYLVAVTALLCEYPQAVLTAVADPRNGIAARFERPSLANIKAVCEEAYAPIARDLARTRAALPAPPPAPRESRLTLDELRARYPGNALVQRALGGRRAEPGSPERRKA